MNRGSVFLMGGKDEGLVRRDVLDVFAKECGGETANLVVLAAASPFEREPQMYADMLLELGVNKARLLYVEKRSDGESPNHLRTLETAHGVLLIGANQLRLTTNLGGTSLAKALRQRHAAGMHLAGISAGASYLCGHMITYGQPGSLPKAGLVTLTPGLGIINSVIIDPLAHRQGMGRLMTALAYNPFAAGVGLHQGVAIVIDERYDLKVLCTGGVTLLDPSELEHSSIDEADSDEPVCMIGLKMHVLTAEMVYNIKTQEVRKASTMLRPPEEARPVSWIG